MSDAKASVVKQGFRFQNDMVAASKEQIIRSKLKSDIQDIQLQIKNLEQKKNDYGTAILIVGGIIGLFLFCSLFGFLGGIVITGIAAAGGLALFDKSYAPQIDELKTKVSSITADAERRIKEIYNQSAQKTAADIQVYDQAVNTYCQKILRAPEKMSPMVDHIVAMFQRMISHADTGTYMRFVESDLIYQVFTNGIQYTYQSNYTNPQDDFNFNRQRFRDLNSDAECEGLAKALSKLVIEKMKTLYPPNSINITRDHMDARVTLHFKGANKNFIPAKTIV